MLEIANLPLGSNGSLQVSESAGVLTVSAAVAEPSLGMSQSLSLSFNGVALLNAWAASSSNASLAAALKEAASLLGALPA